MLPPTRTIPSCINELVRGTRGRVTLDVGPPLALELREVAQPADRVPDVEEEPEPVRADGAVLGHHEHVREVPVERRRQGGRRGEPALEVVLDQRRVDLGRGAVERRDDVALRGLGEQRRVERRSCLVGLLAGEPSRLTELHSL